MNRLRSLSRGLRSRSFSGALTLFKGFLGVVLVLAFISAPSARAVDPICPDASHLSGGLCISDTSSIAALTSSSVENCPTPLSGQTATLNTSTHQCVLSAVTVAASVGSTYTCPSGGVLTGSGSSSTCVTSQVSHPASLTQTFYCPSGTPTASGASGILDTCATQTILSSVPASTTPVWICYSGTRVLRGGVNICVLTFGVLGAPPVSTSTSTCSSNTTLINGLCNSYSVTTYPSATQNMYSCPTGQKLSGTWCQVSFSYSAPATLVGTQYVCPSGGVPDGVNTPPLCRTSTLTSSVAPTITFSLSCMTGVLTGSDCVVTPENLGAPAVGSISFSPCGSPAVNVGANCVVYSNVITSASVSNGYGCSSGTPSGSGSSMICITVYSSTVSATLNGISDTSGFTGGTLVNSGTNYFRIFTTSGTLGGVSGSSPSVDVLVLGAGGGGGGGGVASTGGGGGGAISVATAQVLTGSTQTVVVGVGGTPGAPYNGASGGSSSFFGLSSPGGTGGGNTVAGTSGGVGGGDGSVGGAAGGDGSNAYSAWAAATSTGVGGYYAGGGGSGTNGTSGGAGGGGHGNNGSNGVSGAINTGSGGGGGLYATGGSGADGLVIIKWAGGYTPTYFCPLGTSSGTGSSMVCVTTPASSVSSIITYSGTCATDYVLNTVTGFCDSTSYSLGTPQIPTGSFYCSQTDLGSTHVTYSLLPYDGSAYNGSSLRTCSAIPPVGFVMNVPDSSQVFLSSYLCELFKVDPKTLVQTTLDYASDTDNSGQDASGGGYVSCTLVFTDTTNNADSGQGSDGSPAVDGSGDTSGYIADVVSCFTTTDPSDISALTACLNAI